MDKDALYSMISIGCIIAGTIAIQAFSGEKNILFIKSYTLTKWYGFWIGAAFSGVLGVGFYPLLGSRVWCRFGCPMAAILGLQQRLLSRFRISTNGGNVFLVEIVQPIARWELMFAPMHKKDKTLCAPLVWDAGSVLRYAHEGC